VAEARKQEDSSKLEEYSSYKLLVVVATEAREQASKFSVGDSHRKFTVEEKLEVGL
jgi:hypothetical protein